MHLPITVDIHGQGNGQSGQINGRDKVHPTGNEGPEGDVEVYLYSFFKFGTRCDE